MSIHPSLSSISRTKKHRSVLKRFEKLKVLIGKGKWQLGDQVFGLPKVKMIKIKIKKEKAAEKDEAAVAAAPKEGAVKAAKAAPQEKGKEGGKPKKK